MDPDLGEVLAQRGQRHPLGVSTQRGDEVRRTVRLALVVLVLLVDEAQVLPRLVHVELGELGGHFRHAYRAGCCLRAKFADENGRVAAPQLSRGHSLAGGQHRARSERGSLAERGALADLAAHADRAFVRERRRLNDRASAHVHVLAHDRLDDDGTVTHARHLPDLHSLCASLEQRRIPCRSAFPYVHSADEVGARSDEARAAHHGRFAADLDSRRRHWHCPKGSGRA